MTTVERLRDWFGGLPRHQRTLLLLAFGFLLLFVLVSIGAQLGLITTDTAVAIGLPSFFAWLGCGTAFFVSLAAAKRNDLTGLKTNCTLLVGAGVFVGVLGLVKGFSIFLCLGIASTVVGVLGHLYTKWKEREKVEYY